MRLSQIVRSLFGQKDTRTEQERVADIRKAMFARHARQRLKAAKKAEQKHHHRPWFDGYDD